MAAIVRAISRTFPDTGVDVLKTVAKFCAAALAVSLLAATAVSLLVATYGLDLSPGFF